MNTIIQKTIRTICMVSCSLFLSSALAQAPQKMSYQAVIRNASNALVTNANIRMRISVLQGTASGTAVYVETQTATTNANGLVTVEIGAGTAVSGTFASISWGTNAYFIKTETDPTGGTNYTIVGTSQFLSVPYALFASNSGTTQPSPALSAQSSGAFGLTARNQWVDCPDASVTVPQDGKYLLTFYGNAENGNYYQEIPSNTIFDFNCEARVIVEGDFQGLFTMVATSRIRHDGTSNGNLVTPASYTYFNIQPSRTMQLDLVAGQILKVQYIQNLTEGTGTLTTGWNIGQTGLSIYRIGN